MENKTLLLHAFMKSKVLETVTESLLILSRIFPHGRYKCGTEKQKNRSDDLYRQAGKTRCVSYSALWAFCETL